MGDYTALDALKSRLDALRPIDPKQLTPVIEKFRLDWTYHSNAIEGNPLTFSETSFFVREGLTSKGKPLAAYLEIKNHLAALDLLEEIVRERTPTTEGLIKQYHAMLFKNIEYIEVKTGTESRRIRVDAGVYKLENNHVIQLDGNIRYFTETLQVHGEIDRLVHMVEDKKTLHPIELSGILHHGLASIHPFVDGNGRVARLLMNTVLMQAGYTPAIIPVEDKKRYLEALQAADRGSYTLLFELIEELVNKSLLMTLDILEGRDAFDFDDLARMFRNIAEQATAIEQELGPATVTPEIRASQTAAKIAEITRGFLNDYVKKATTPHVNLGLNLQPGLFDASAINLLRQRIPPGTLATIAELQISSPKRFVPNLAVQFFSVSGRHQVALGTSRRIGKFDEHLREQFVEAPRTKDLSGSIYFEDWDLQVMSEFVLNAIKEAIKDWTSEMDRRKALIAAEEAQIDKFRTRLK